MNSGRKESGQGTLEFLLVLIVLIMLFFGSVELARGVAIYSALNSSVGVATRSISLDPSQWSWATQVVDESIENNIMGQGSASDPTLTAYDSAGTSLTGTQLGALGFGDTFRLEGVVTYTPWLPMITGNGQEIAIRVSHWGIVERYP